MAKKISISSTEKQAKCFYSSLGNSPTPYELGEKTVILTNLMKEDGTFTESGIVFNYAAQEVSETVKEGFTVTYDGTSVVDQIGPSISLDDFKRLELDKTGVLYLFKLDNDCDHTISELLLFVDFMYRKDGTTAFVSLSTAFNLSITRDQIETFGIYLDPESIAKTPQGVDGQYRFVFRRRSSDTNDRFIYSKPVLAKPSVALTEAFPYFKNANNTDKLKLIQAIFPPFWGTYTIGTVASCLYDSLTVDSGSYIEFNNIPYWGINYNIISASEFYNYYVKVKYNLASTDVTSVREDAVRTVMRYFPYEAKISKSKNEVTSKEGELEGFLRTRGKHADGSWYPLLVYYNSQLQGTWSYEAVRWDLTSSGVYAYLRLCGITNEDMHSFFYSLPMDIEEFDFKDLRLALKETNQEVSEGNLVSASAVKDGKVISQIEVRIQQ